MLKSLIPIFVLLISFPSSASDLSCESMYESPFAVGRCFHSAGDYKNALRHWLPAAADDSWVQKTLGDMYYYGRGVPVNYKTALEWYHLSAESNHGAQTTLGSIYEEGKIVSRNYKIAAQWYRLAAANKNEFAQEYLGRLYRDGKGVPQDYVFAHMWFNIAASAGLKSAAAERDYLADKKMTLADVSKAQKLARVCVTKGYEDC